MYQGDFTTERASNSRIVVYGWVKMYATATATATATAPDFNHGAKLSEIAIQLHLLL